MYQNGYYYWKTYREVRMREDKCSNRTFQYQVLINDIIIYETDIMRKALEAFDTACDGWKTWPRSG